MISALIVIVLILMLAGSVPAWPYSRNWGYGPTGLVGVILVVVIMAMVLGRL